MYSYRETICRIKRENGELETSLREAGVFFSRRVKKEPKKASAPRRPTGNAQSLILYPRKEVLAEVILRRELSLCTAAPAEERGGCAQANANYTCVFHLLLGCLWQKNESTSKKDEMADGSPRRHCVTHSPSSRPIF